MNESELKLLNTCLELFSQGSISKQTMIQHIECIIDTKEVDTIIKLNSKKYASIS